MKLIDIGANLTHHSFADDLDAVIAASKAADIAHIILTGTDLQSSREASKLADTNPGFFSSTAGFHPHVAASCSEDQFAEITALAQQPQVIAIGETGLDFNRNYSPREDQLALFERHLQLAVELQKPLFLHQRDAHEAFHRLLQRYRPDLVGGVVHCFTDTEAALSDYLELDMYIGVTGWICDERRGKSLQTQVGQIPTDRLLIETDAPYLLPRTLSPKPKDRRNEPKYLVQVLTTVAECTGRTPEVVAEQTSSNAMRLFGLNVS